MLSMTFLSDKVLDKTKVGGEDRKVNIGGQTHTIE